MPAPQAEAIAPDLSWAVRCGATEADTARTLLARRAASNIHSIDRLSGAQAAYLRLQAALEPSRADSFAAASLPAQQHERSTYQHSAP